jgi:hypothetical protein
MVKHECTHCFVNTLSTHLSYRNQPQADEISPRNKIITF